MEDAAKVEVPLSDLVFIRVQQSATEHHLLKKLQKAVFLAQCLQPAAKIDAVVDIRHI